MVGGFRPIVVGLLCNERALLRVPGALVFAMVLLAAAVLGPGGLSKLWLPTEGAPRLGFSSSLLFSAGLISREEELRLLCNPLTGSLEPEEGDVAAADRPHGNKLTA